MYILLCGYPPFCGIEEILRADLEFPEKEWSGGARRLERQLEQQKRGWGPGPPE